MPDLTSELQQMADHAAHTARPPAVADIIARGSRRRVRSTAQKSLAALSVAGVTAAVILTGAASSDPSAPTAGGTQSGGNTLTETTSSAAGTMTSTVKYRYEPGGTIRLLSVTCSGRAASAGQHSVLVLIGAVNFPGSQVSVNSSQATSYGRKSAIFFVIIRQHGRDFAGSLSARDLKTVRQLGNLPGGEGLSVLLDSAPNSVSAGQSAPLPHPAGQSVVLLRPSMQDNFILTSRPR